MRVRETITLIDAWSTQSNKYLFSAVVFCFGRHLLRANDDDDDACGFFFYKEIMYLFIMNSSDICYFVLFYFFFV